MIEACDAYFKRKKEKKTAFDGNASRLGIRRYGDWVIGCIADLKFILISFFIYKKSHYLP